MANIVYGIRHSLTSIKIKTLVCLLLLAGSFAVWPEVALESIDRSLAVCAVVLVSTNFLTSKLPFGELVWLLAQLTAQLHFVCVVLGAMLFEKAVSTLLFAMILANLLAVTTFTLTKSTATTTAKEKARHGRILNSPYSPVPRQTWITGNTCRRNVLLFGARLSSPALAGYTPWALVYTGRGVGQKRLCYGCGSYRDIQARHFICTKPVYSSRDSREYPAFLSNSKVLKAFRELIKNDDLPAFTYSSSPELETRNGVSSHLYICLRIQLLQRRRQTRKTSCILQNGRLKRRHFCSKSSAKMTTGSRINKWAICLAINSSTPTCSEIKWHWEGKGTICLEFFRNFHVKNKFQVIVLGRNRAKCNCQLGRSVTCWNGPLKGAKDVIRIILETVGRTQTPRSSSVRSSTDFDIMFQRQSTSARCPRYIGAPAVRQSISGHNTAKWSYKWRASTMLQAWKVICKQEQPIPKHMQSMYIWSGFPGVAKSDEGAKDRNMPSSI